MIYAPSDETIGALGAMFHPVDNPDPIPDRTSMEAVLHRFASGSTDSEDLFVMRVLAYRLLSASGKDALGPDAPPIAPSKRADLILRASGLHGKHDRHREFVRIALSLEGFEGYTVSGGIQMAKAAGALASDVDEPSERKILSRYKNKRK